MSLFCASFLAFEDNLHKRMPLCYCEFGERHSYCFSSLGENMEDKGNGSSQKSNDPSLALTPELYIEIYNTQHFLDEMEDEELFSHMEKLKLAMRNGAIELKHSEDIVNRRKATGDKARREKIRELDKEYKVKPLETHEKLSKEDKMYALLAKTMGVDIRKAKEILAGTKKENEEKKEEKKDETTSM